MVTPRHKTYSVWWSRLLAGAVVLFPYSLSNIDYRSMLAQGLSVSAHKSSPAYAAFEELTREYKSEEISIPDNGMRLASGTKVDPKFVRQATQARTLTLAGMTVRAPVQAVPQPIYVASTPASQVAAIRFNPNDEYDPRVENLPQHERKKILAAQLKEQDWSQPTVGTLAHQLAEQEIANATTKVIRSHTGTPITISRPVDSNPTPNRVAAIEPEEQKEEVPDDSFVASFNPIQPTGGTAPYSLRGQVEMTGGLAFVGPETRMQVMRVYNGQVLERGRIWVSEGRFEISVKRALGYLVAELQTRDGRTLGRGEINLVHLTGAASKNNRIDDIRLALRPTTEGATFRTISGYSHGQQAMPLSTARVEIESFSAPQAVNEEAVFSDSTLTRDSSFVARATAEKHWASVVVGQANRPQDIRVFSNTLVEALIGLQLKGSDIKDARLASIVWGQIGRDGQPVAGAHVEMAGSYQVVYFNELYLPDPSLKKTSANGLFAFLNVKRGVQALRVKMSGRMYPAQVFPTEDKHVSYVELQLRDKMISQFRVFDVMDIEKPVNAQVRLVGTDEALPVEGKQLVEYAMAADPFMVEAEAGPEYEISRTTMTGSPHLVQVPLIRREWLHQIYNDKGIVHVPGRGIVAGFIDDQDFEIEMTGYAPQEPMQIVYFDAQGKVVEGRTGIAGGGFVIFNAPMGLQTVYVHPTQSRETFSQVVVAEPQYVHVLTWAPGEGSRK